MKISSFDIFDTCLVRKCGEPQNVLDILSYRVFNAPVSDRLRKEFIMARRMADISTYSNPSALLADIYDAMQYSHPMLKPKEQLCIIEQELEREMLIPVPAIKERIVNLRAKGHRIIFISDMYLNAEFLAQILQAHGIMQHGDGLYVSCEVGLRKADGSLFQYIQSKERIPYNQWTHYGDNELSDYKIPRSLGIKAERLEWSYTPYQIDWLCNSTSPQNRMADTLAGICRSLHVTLPDSTHRDFLVDIAAPLFVSFTYRVLKRAQEEGIKRLYFCARDAHIIYYIAEAMLSYFPDLTIHYLYISRDALYKGNHIVRMKYFEQCGLASNTDKCAIVDLRTSGKTLCVLNNQLESEGYLSVKGFFFEIYCTGTIENIPSNYYAELMTPYYIQKTCCSPIFLHHYLVEMYISVHNEQRTINYVENEKGQVYPVFAIEKTEFAEDNASMPNINQRCDEHKTTLLAFARLFLATNLNQYVDDVFKLALQTWVKFSNKPEAYYLSALTDFYSSKPNSDALLPYVKKMSPFEIIKSRGKNTIWKRASIIYSLPSFLAKWYQNRK